VLHPAITIARSLGNDTSLTTSSKTGHWGDGIAADDMPSLRWVKPKIVVEVSSVEWTRDGLLRHPEFIGARDDKSPREIRREER
jgi:ATP-dependent DNA ligase